ncbi:MAG: alpha/beta hydrolase [Bacteroidota bacterium]
MKIYGISGLGADKRVFERLSFDYEFQFIEWIEPKPKEPLEAYSMRLADIIDQREPFVLIGVSFGGLVAVEISKRLNPALTILISSAATKHDIPLLYRWIGKLGIPYVMPEFLAKPPLFFAEYMFNAEDKVLLRQILIDTDLSFSKWAIGELTKWKNEELISNCVKICGQIDKILPPMQYEDVIEIENGGHFMIADQAKLISKIINEKVKTLS